MTGGNDRSHYADCNANGDDSPQPVGPDGADGPPQKCVAGNYRHDHALCRILRCEAGGLPSFERERSVSFQCSNLYAAFRAGDQAGSVGCAPNRSRNIGSSIRCSSDDVIASAHR